MNYKKKANGKVPMYKRTQSACNVPLRRRKTAFDTEKGKKSWMKKEISSATECLQPECE